MKREKTKLVCQFCGEEFYSKSGHLKQKTCSKECGYKLRDKNGSKKKGKHYPHLRRAKIRKCLICKKKFRAVNDFSGKIIRKQKYCSKECWAKRNPPVTKKCLHCKKEFKTYERRAKKYCCVKCRNLDYRKRMKGEGSSFWQGGKTEESKLRRTRAKYKEWRLAVFTRDNFTCQKCEAKSKKGKRIYLEAHHIKSQSEYPELIYDIDNGMTLCHECHKKTDNYGLKKKSKSKTKK